LFFLFLGHVAPFYALSPEGGCPPNRGKPIVVSAADVDATSLFGLTDDFGTPQRGVFYNVEVVEPKPRRRGKRLAGVGEFRDLRQLSLIPGGRP
jgi:hypothetical protein